MSAVQMPSPAPASLAHWPDRPIRACSCDACAELDLQFPGGGRQLALMLLPPPLPNRLPHQLESLP